jgi:Ser/Thr protein kinase RdoA (MazF antagonist)
MNERDITQIVGECAGAVSVCWAEIDKAGIFDSTQAAKHVQEALAEIIAAGYRKPRTLTTAEELRDLPVTAVVLGKWLAQKWADPEGELWHVAGKGMVWDSEQLIQRGGLPTTVLHEGEK